MTSNCVLKKKNQIYWPLSFTGKLSSDFGLLSKMKSNLEDLYLNIKQCILILLKKYIIWSHNLVLLLLKKRTLFSKIPAVSVHESKRVSCCSKLWKRLYSVLVLASFWPRSWAVLGIVFFPVNLLFSQWGFPLLLDFLSDIWTNKQLWCNNFLYQI